MDKSLSMPDKKPSGFHLVINILLIMLIKIKREIKKVNMNENISQ
jgi:hypothetical protein